MCRAQEKVVTECARIAKNVAYLVSNVNLLVEGKRYVQTRSHGLVDGKTELSPLWNTKVLQPVAKKAKDTAEAAAKEDMTMRE